MDVFLDNEFGQRYYLCKYFYSDIVLSLLGNSLCNGSYVSDIEYFIDKFIKQFFDKIPSADTVEYACQELKNLTLVTTTPDGIKHQENYCDKKNKTLLSLALFTGVLEKNYWHPTKFKRLCSIKYMISLVCFLGTE